VNNHTENGRRRVAIALGLVTALSIASAADATETAPLIAYSTVTGEMIETETKMAMERSDAILAEMVAIDG
jgi:predicted outer membrane protein